jgi:hypothetical protein
MPTRYSDVSLDADIVAINDKTVLYRLIYRGDVVGPICTFNLWKSNDSTLSLFHVVMMVNGKYFHGTAHSLNTYRRLTSSAGNASWFTEYRPLQFQGNNYAPSIVIVIQTPHLLLSIGFVRSVYSRVFKGFPSGHVLYRDDRHPVLNLIFKKVPVTVENFNIGPFHFRLVDEQPQSMCTLTMFQKTISAFLLLFSGLIHSLIVAAAITLISYISFGKISNNLDSKNMPWSNFLLISHLPLLGCCISNIPERKTMVGTTAHNVPPVAMRIGSPSGHSVIVPHFPTAPVIFVDDSLPSC